MDFDIDARGLTCPKPVIKVKEALSERAGPFVILVDNAAARDNVSRFANNSGCAVEVTDHHEGFLVSVIPGDETALKVEEVPVTCPAPTVKKVLFIGADEVGRGDRELGTTLAKAFLYACTENEDRPDLVIFMNSGVRLVTENDETAAHVRTLEGEGAEVLVCGTCLDFYGLKELLQAGRVSNMYEIQSALTSADRLVSL